MLRVGHDLRGMRHAAVRAIALTAAALSAAIVTSRSLV